MLPTCSVEPTRALACWMFLSRRPITLLCSGYPPTRRQSDRPDPLFDDSSNRHQYLRIRLVQPHNASKDFVFSYEHAVIPCEIRDQAPLSEAELVSGECGRSRVTIEGETYGERPFASAKNIWLSMLASIFLHGSWLHLLGNMLFLWVFGNNIEERFGKVGFLAFFAAAGIAATFAQVLVEPGSTIPIVGASGAIAGVMGAYLVLFPRARILTWWPMFVILVVYIPAAVVLGLWFLMQFAIDPNSGVAWAAHVGGFVFGAFVALILRSHLKPPPIVPERPIAG